MCYLLHFGGFNSKKCGEDAARRISADNVEKLMHLVSKEEKAAVS